jgi:hypothetical protein
MFKLPVQDDNTRIESGITDDSAHGDYLREAAFVVWDELPMANVAAFSAADILLCRIMETDLPFGGKVVIAVRDFHQVGPVVKGGGPSACYMASVLSLELWGSYKIHQLMAPMQNAADPEFADFVDGISEDTSAKRINLQPFLQHSSNLDEIQEYLFPDSILRDPAACVRRALLTPLNINVEKFNSDILDHLPGCQSMLYIPSYAIIYSLCLLSGAPQF